MIQIELCSSVLWQFPCKKYIETYITLDISILPQNTLLWLNNTQLHFQIPYWKFLHDQRLLDIIKLYLTTWLHIWFSSFVFITSFSEEKQNILLGYYQNIDNLKVNFRFVSPNIRLVGSGQKSVKNCLILEMCKSFHLFQFLKE